MVDFLYIRVLPVIHRDVRGIRRRFETHAWSVADYLELVGASVTYINYCSRLFGIGASNTYILTIELRDVSFTPIDLTTIDALITLNKNVHPPKVY